MQAPFAALLLSVLVLGCATPPARVDTFSGLKTRNSVLLAGPGYRNLDLAVIASENSAATARYLESQTGMLYGRSIDGVHIRSIAEGLIPLFKGHFNRVLAASSPAEAEKMDVTLMAVVDVFAKMPASIFHAASFEVAAHFMTPSGEPVDAVKSSVALKPKGVGMPAVNRAISDVLSRGMDKFEEALLTSQKLQDFARTVPAKAPEGASAGPASAEVPAVSRRRYASDVDVPGFQQADDPSRFAVVIGIENYRNLPKADFAQRDAQAVYAHLRAAGYPERNIIRLTGEGATISDMEKYIEEWLPLNVREDSSLFFYFSGHGAPNPSTGEAYLVPWNGDAKFLKTTGYPLKKLYASLSGLKSKDVTVAIDACFSGAGGRSVLAQGARPLVMKVDTDVADENKLALLAAASGDEITGTLESQGHGLFTYYLLKGLNGEAKDAKGRVTVQGLYDYLSPLVQDEARRDNRVQSPMIAGSARDRVLLKIR